MGWTDTYVFVEPMRDLRSDPTHAAGLGAELARELGPGHELFGLPCTVVAESLPWDEVLVVADGRAFLVHLTWARRPEQPPWPDTELVESAEAFERLIEFRYGWSP